MDDAKPLFLQIAESLEGQIVSGALPEGTQAPSTNELAAFYRINPATAAKGMGLLVDQGILQKRRGIGMFVAEGARAQLLLRRQEAFTKDFVKPLVAEALALDLSAKQVRALVEEEMNQQANDASFSTVTVKEGQK